MQQHLLLLASLSLVAVVGACSAAGGDPTFWDKGGNVPTTQGVGGNGTTTGAGAGSTGSGGSTSSSTSGGTSTSSSSSSSTSGGTSTSSSTTSASSSASSTASSASGAPAAVTWTELYNSYFGIGAPADCSRNGGCHTNSKSGFKCGSSKSTCYSGWVASGYVSPGGNASSSAIADPAQSCLNGTLGGNMPTSGYSFSSSDVSKIQSWLGNGAPND